MTSLADLMTKAWETLPKNPSLAARMLLENRPAVGEIPPKYDLLIGRAALAAGDLNCALEHIGRVAAETDPTAKSPYKLYADALIQAGRVAEAGQCVGQAVRAGTKVAALSMHHRVVLDDHGPREPEGELSEANIANSFPASRSMFDEGHRVILATTPKNACTVMKATLVMNSPLRARYLESGEAIHSFCDTEWPRGMSIAAFRADDVFRLTVLRDPCRRLLSAYLNKVVPPTKHSKKMLRDKLKMIRGAQELCGVPYDLERSITFEEFCRYLVTISDAEMNVHWMPQIRFVGTDMSVFQHVGRLEKLEDTFRVLEDRFGYTAQRDAAAHNGGSKHNTTIYSDKVVLTEPYRRTPEELAPFRRSGYPPADSFLTPELQEIIRGRYAKDVAILAAAG